jgi:acyl-CoA reductase-like NAD-dependent aldehyde dehydrogenase
MKLASLVGGKPVNGSGTLTIRSPYNGAEVGTVRLASRRDVDTAVAAACAFRETPSRYQRAEILEKTRTALETRREEFALTIASEAGLALREGTL